MDSPRIKTFFRPGLATGLVLAFGPAGWTVASAPVAAAVSASIITMQDDAGAEAQAEDSPPIPSHDPAKEEDLGDGLIVVDLTEGSGEEVVPHSLVRVRYTGWLADNGNVFDSNTAEDRDPFVTSIPGRLIEGWNRGMLGMREGGKRKLIIPSELAYGANSVGRIPPDSDLIFEVEMLDVTQPPKVDPSKAEKMDNGALYIDTVAGEGPALEQNGFGHVHLIVWDDKGEFRGSTFGAQPLLVKPNQERYWVPYTLGMKAGGERIAEIEDPSPRPVQPGGDTDAGDGSTEAAPEPVEEERGRWTLKLQMVDVAPAIKQTPHEPSDERDYGDGLIVVDLVEGEGESIPEHGIPVIQYSAWLEDGTLFDSTYLPGNEPVFASPGLVIKAWERGLQDMKVGGKRKLIVPPALGYADRGYPRLGVPANATLIYEVELLRYEMPLFLPVEGEGGGLFDFGDLEDIEGGEEEDDGDGEGDGGN